MLNWKRFLMRLALFLAVVFVLLGSSVYFFDVNDYSQWITEQIKQSTGYDLRFEQLDNSWVTDNRVSLMGVSLYQQQQRVASIQQVDIRIDKLDLWQRQLELNSITLKGVDVELDTALIELQAATESKSEQAPRVSNPQDLAWNRLLVKKINLIDFNATLKNQEQQIQIQNMHVDLKDLLVINNKQLQILPLTLNVATQIEALQLRNEQQSIQLNELQLVVKGELLQRQLQVDLGVARVVATAKQLPVIELEEVQLDLQLERDNLRLNNFSMDAFGGDLALQANASVVLTLLPEPTIKVKQAVVQALQIKNMQLTIPNWESSTTPNEVRTEQPLLPLESLLLEKLQLENIDLASANDALPLRLNNLQLSVADLALIKSNQWVKFFEETDQHAIFSLAFDSLSWEEMLIEQFFVAGSLTEERPTLQLLQQKFLEND